MIDTDPVTTWQMRRTIMVKLYEDKLLLMAQQDQDIINRCVTKTLDVAIDHNLDIAQFKQMLGKLDSLLKGTE